MVTTQVGTRSGHTTSRLLQVDDLEDKAENNDDNFESDNETIKDDIGEENEDNLI